MNESVTGTRPLRDVSRVNLVLIKSSCTRITSLLVRTSSALKASRIFKRNSESSNRLRHSCPGPFKVLRERMLP